MRIAGTVAKVKNGGMNRLTSPNVVAVLLAALFTVNLTVEGWIVLQVRAVDARQSAAAMARAAAEQRIADSLIGIVQRLSLIEGTRFTNEDGRDLWKEYGVLREMLAKKANVADVPPPEVLRRLERLELEIRELSRGKPDK